MRTPFDTVETAIESIQAGDVIIVVTTHDSTEYGAFVVAAQHVRPDALNLLLSRGRGFLAVPVDQALCLKFGLRVLESTRPDNAFYTISYNLLINGRPTGQSVEDITRAIRALADAATSANQLRTPGYVHPVLTTAAGVLRTQNHYCATTDLVRLAGLTPAGVTIQILSTDGELETLDGLFDLAATSRLKIISIEELVRFRRERARLNFEENENVAS